MKRKIFCALFAALFLCGCFLPAYFVHCENVSYSQKVSYRFVNDETTKLCLSTLRSDGTVFRVKNFLIFLTYYETALGKDSAQSAFISVPSAYSTDIRLDISFIPKIGVDYTFQATMWDSQGTVIPTSAVSGVRMEAQPVIQTVMPVNAPISIGAPEGGFVNDTDAQGFGVTSLTLQLMNNGQALNVSELAKFYFRFMTDDELDIVSLSPVWQNGEGTYRFEPCAEQAQFIPQKDSVYRVELWILDKNVKRYGVLSELPCEIEPVLPAKDLILEAKGYGIENTTLGFREVTVLNAHLTETELGLFACDLLSEYDCYLSMNGVQKKLRPAVIDTFGETITFDLTSADLLPAVNEYNSVQIELKDAEGRVCYRSNVCDAFVPRMRPIAYEALCEVTASPRVRTFLKNDLVCTYITPYPVYDDVEWEVCLAATEDPQRRLSFRAVPSAIIEDDGKASFAFTVPDGTEYQFADGEALTLTVSATVTNGETVTYFSKETQGYRYDLNGHEPVVPNTTDPIVTPSEGKRTETKTVYLILGGACATAVLTALIFSAADRRRAQRKR